MISEITIDLVLPEPETVTVPSAVPVLLSVTFAALSVIVLTSVYVTTYVTGPDFVELTDGEPITTDGPTASAVNAVVDVTAATPFPTTTFTISSTHPWPQTVSV